MKLQQEVKEKEVVLEQCYIRMERGEAPDEEAEKTWMKMLRDEQRKNQEKIRRTEVTCYFTSILNVPCTNVFKNIMVLFLSTKNLKKTSTFRANACVRRLLYTVTCNVS
jgi:hypothetical protein